MYRQVKKQQQLKQKWDTVYTCNYTDRVSSTNEYTQ